MLFGLRFDLRNPAFAGVSMHDRYRAALDMAAWADERGGLFVCLSEHHGSSDGYLPSALTMAAAIAARTERIRIWCNAVAAPLHDPVRLAEQAAVVDQISGGRLDLTVAGGYVADEFAMAGVHLADRPRAVTETVATLRAAWTGAPFVFRGREVVVTPTPHTTTGPPISLGGSSVAAARRAARIADGFVPSEPEFWEPYRQARVELGHDDPGPFPGGDTRVVLLADDLDVAWQRLGTFLLHETNAYGAWRTDGEVATSYRPMSDVDEVRASDRYRILTPEAYRSELDTTRGFPFTLLHPMVGGIPPELAWEQLQLFEQRVLGRSDS